MLEISDRCNYAVSDVVGFVFVLTIIIGAVVAILFWGIPYMNQQSAMARFDSALTQFDVINSVIRDEIIRQGNSSSSIVSFTADTGSISIDSKGERFIFYYSLHPDLEFNVTGLEDNDDYRFTIATKGGSADQMFIRYLYKESFNEYKNFNEPTSHPLSDAIQIDIYNTTGPPSVGVVGRIWLFDTGSIIYETLSSSGIYKVITENGGIISSIGQSGFLYDKPNIMINDEKLAMRVIQFKTDNVISGFGKATYRFTIKLNYSDIRVESEDISGSFRMQIYGDDVAVKAWIDYFNSTFGFKKFVGLPADGTLYLPGSRSFTFSQSICKLYMEMS